MTLKEKLFLGFAVALSISSAALANSPSPPAFRGTTGQFTLLTPFRPAPDITIHALDGTTVDLDRFRGRVVVINFWASWCRPCVYEMPSLDRLAAETDPSRIAVIAVSIDRNGAEAVVPFIAAHNLTHLPIYLDPDQRLGSFDMDHVPIGAMRLWGLPITYVIDQAGRVIGYLTGAAKWESPQAEKLLDYFLQQTAP